MKKEDKALKLLAGFITAFILFGPAAIAIHLEGYKPYAYAFWWFIIVTTACYISWKIKD